MNHSLEYQLSKLLKEDLIAYIESNPNKMEELTHLAASNKPPHSARAAYLLSKIIKKKEMEIPIAEIQHILPFVEDGQKRDLINVLDEITLSEQEEGKLYDACVAIWSDLSKIPSVRFIALKFILKTGRKYPELNNEIILLTEEHYLETLSEGIKRAILKRLNAFQKAIKLSE